MRPNTAIALRVNAEARNSVDQAGTNAPFMPMKIEVEPEVASKIQAGARERGVSVNVYLRELIDQKGTESERSNALSSQERVRLLREWAAGHSVNAVCLGDDAVRRENMCSDRD